MQRIQLNLSIHRDDDLLAIERIAAGLILTGLKVFVDISVPDGSLLSAQDCRRVTQEASSDSGVRAGRHRFGLSYPSYYTCPVLTSERSVIRRALRGLRASSDCVHTRRILETRSCMVGTRKTSGMPRRYDQKNRMQSSLRWHETMRPLSMSEPPIRSGRHSLSVGRRRHRRGEEQPENVADISPCWCDTSLASSVGRPLAFSFVD